MGPDSVPGQFSPLIYTKVHIPGARMLISRPRLLAFLRENIHHKLLLVCAGPGYGKTSLLVDFARNTDLPVCWYTLDPSDRDPRIFLDYLVEAIRVRFPTFGERTRTLLHQGEVPDLRGAIGLLVNELAELPGQLAIVLDEYQTVDAEDSVSQTLSLLLQYLPENAHLVLASRSVPALFLIQLAAHRKVAGIGSDMLRFTPEEVQAVLRGLGLHPPEEQVRQLTEEGEGWITGILLGAQAVWQEFMNFLAETKGPSDRVYAYLTTEVLGFLPPEVRTFLRQAAILNRMEASLCNALLQRDDSAQVLELLERRNLFLVPLAGGWYRFHGLFRESLLREARGDGDTFVCLNLRAAQLWRERGEVAEAVEHLLQAQAFPEAAREIEQLLTRYFWRGHLRTLLRWIEALPEPVRQEWPRFSLFQGRVYAYMGRGSEAAAALQQAERLLAQAGDREGWIQAVADRSTHLRMQGDYAQALTKAQEVLPAAEQLGVAALVDLYRTVGICYFTQGDLVAAEENLQAAVQRSLTIQLPYNLALAYQDLGVCLRAQGRMQEAEVAYRSALEQGQAVGSPGPLADILNNLAMGPFLRGDLEEAYSLLQQAGEAAQASLSPYYQALVLASLGDLHGAQGDLLSAQHAYQEGLEHARRDCNATLTAYLLEGLGNLVRRKGFLAEARHRLQEAMEIARSSQGDRARIQVSMALLETAEGRPEKALGLLGDAMAVMEQGGDRLHLLQARLAQAVTWHRLRQDEKARQAVAQATALAEDTGIIEPFLAEGEALLPILRHIPRWQENAILREVHRRLRARSAPRQPGPVEETQPVLRLLALGPGRVLCEGQEVPLRDWKGRARELFFYLFFHAPVRREQVGLALWPEHDNTRLRNTFHSLLYRARRAIGGKPFISFRDDAYHWNPEVTCWCDVVAFERLTEQADDLPSSDPQVTILLERAASLYQGDFLEDLNSDWCGLRREGLRERYLQLLLRLGEAYLEQEDLALARKAFERALQVDSFREEAHRGLMESYWRAGERASAIQAYLHCCRHFQQELDVAPSAETQALYQAILLGSEGNSRLENTA